MNYLAIPKCQLMFLMVLLNIWKVVVYVLETLEICASFHLRWSFPYPPLGGFEISCPQLHSILSSLYPPSSLNLTRPAHTSGPWAFTPLGVSTSHMYLTPLWAPIFPPSEIQSLLESNINHHSHVCHDPLLESKGSHPLLTPQWVMQSQGLRRVHGRWQEEGMKEHVGKGGSTGRWINSLVNNNLMVKYSAVKSHDVTEARTSLHILASDGCWDNEWPQYKYISFICNLKNFMSLTKVKKKQTDLRRGLLILFSSSSSSLVWYYFLSEI